MHSMSEMLPEASVYCVAEMVVVIHSLCQTCKRPEQRYIPH